MNVHGQWYLPWMQAAGGQVGQVVIPQQAQTQHAGHAAQAQQALSNPASLDKSGQVWTGNAVSASAQQQLLQQQYMQQQQQLLKYLNQAGGLGQSVQAQQQQQQQNYLNFGGHFIQPHQPQIPISSLVATAAAHAASKLPLLRTPTTLYSKDLLAANCSSSTSSGPTFCSTPEATGAISGNGNNGCSTTLVNSTSGLPVSSAAVMAGTASAAQAAAAAAAQAAAMSTLAAATKRKLLDQDTEVKSDVKKAKIETKALKAKRPGFTDERYNETSYYYDANTNLRKVYPYYFTFTTFTKGRWVGERILDVFAREFRAHPAEEYERCIKAGTLTVNYEKVDIDYRLKHNDLLANIVHRHEVPVSEQEIKIVHIDDDLVVVNKPASIPVHPCGRYRHNTVVFILAKEHGLKNLRTIHRLDRLTSGLLLFGRNPKKAREMEQQIRTRQVQKEYVCRVEGEFPTNPITCKEPIEVVSYKIGVCKVSSNGKDCHTDFQKLSYNGRTSVVLCKPRTGRMHQIRVHLQYLGFPVVNDPLYNHVVFGPEKGKGGRIGKSDEKLIEDLISIHNAENWLGMDDDLGGPMSTSNSVQPSNIASNKIVQEKTSPNVSAGIISNKLRSDTPDSAIGGSDFNQFRAASNSPSSSSPASTASSNGDQGWSGVQLDNVGASSKPASNAASVAPEVKVTIATQTGIEEADKRFDISKLSTDHHCYECKVKYRDPRPKDLVMFLHAWAYSGPDWQYRTELPAWAKDNWVDPDSL